MIPASQYVGARIPLYSLSKALNKMRYSLCRMMNDYYCTESALPGPASAEHLTTLRKRLTVCTKETYILNCVLNVFVYLGKTKKLPVCLD